MKRAKGLLASGLGALATPVGLCLLVYASSVRADPLAFVSDRDGANALFLMDPSRSAAPTNLTPSAPGEACSPSWMPDGKSLVYYLLAASQQTAGVYRVSTAGGQPARIASLQGLDPAGNRLSVSPDGTTLLFESQSRVITFRLADSVTSDLGNGYFPAWTADGRILFTRLGSSQLFLMNADGSGELPIQLQPPAVECLGYRTEGGTCMPFDIWMAPTDSYQQDAREAIGRADTIWPALAPDGSRLAAVQFLAIPWYGFEAYHTRLVVLSGTSGASVAFGGLGPDFIDAGQAGEYGGVYRGPCCPSWSADSKVLAFSQLVDRNLEILLLSADATRPVNLTNHPAQDSQPVWAPRGTASSVVPCSWGTVKARAPKTHGGR
jgi:Tol biopolymer transport system component